MIVWMVFRPLRPSALDESRLANGRVKDIWCVEAQEPTVPTFNSYTNCVGSPGRIHDRTPDPPPPPHFRWHGRIYDVTTYHSFDSQATRFIDVFRLFLDMSFMGVCTTRHSQTSGRLIQELNICTIVDELALITFEQLIKGQLYNDAFP